MCRRLRRCVKKSRPVSVDRLAIQGPASHFAKDSLARRGRTVIGLVLPASGALRTRRSTNCFRRGHVGTGNRQLSAGTGPGSKKPSNPRAVISLKAALPLAVGDSAKQTATTKMETNMSLLDKSGRTEPLWRRCSTATNAAWRAPQFMSSASCRRTTGRGILKRPPAGFKPMGARRGVQAWANSR